MIAFFNLFMEILAVRKRSLSGFWEFRVAVLTMSGISSPRHGWVKSRVCPALVLGQSCIGEASGVSERGKKTIRKLRQLMAARST